MVHILWCSLSSRLLPTPDSADCGVCRHLIRLIVAFVYVYMIAALFRGLEHQDAQEFLNYLLNACSDALDKEAKEAQAARGGDAASSASVADAGAALVPAAATSTSFIKGLFEGVLANETKYV